MADKTIRTIGVLTSGGDAPGMNAAIRAVVRTALGKGLRVRGIRKGYQGLLDEDIIDLTARDVSDTIQRGGTFLQTARCSEMRTKEGQQEAAAICKKYEIDGLVVIGGDGSFAGAQKLSHYGINTVGIPGTIDLDIACTEYTIGFDTAVNTAMEAIDKVRDTSTSHERCSIIEVWEEMQDIWHSGVELPTVQSESLCRKNTTMMKRRSLQTFRSAESAGRRITSSSMQKVLATL